jgi:signal transduction histidine kinase
MDSTVTRSSRASRSPSPSSESLGEVPEPAALLRTLEGAGARDIGEAAVRVAALLPPDLHLGEEEVWNHLAWIASVCVDYPASLDDNGYVLTIRRRLVDLIREEMVRGWSVRPSSREAMLDALQRLERAQKACVPSCEQTFAAELADHGGLDLVVEIAHDMRSPLTSILFLSEILHRGQSGAFNEVQKRQIGIIYSAALGLVGMASDMIEMAKGGNRLPTLAPGPFSVNEVLTSVYDLVRPMAEEKRLELRIETLHSEHRMGFPIPINRVLLNLATNALKFTQEGSVELAAQPIEGSRIRFSVRDTGPGISPQAMESLYQPFRREPNRESGYSFSGTGLGLAICRRLVSALGSSLVVDTAPSAGTCFSFELDLPPVSSLTHS